MDACGSSASTCVRVWGNYLDFESGYIVIADFYDGNFSVKLD